LHQELHWHHQPWRRQRELVFVLGSFTAGTAESRKPAGHAARQPETSATAEGAEGRGGFQLVDHPLEAVFEVKHVEVDQQPFPHPQSSAILRGLRGLFGSVVGFTAEGRGGSSLLTSRLRPSGHCRGLEAGYRLPTKRSYSE
jgi:hypothetical protein